jgi:hypothetical protein
MYWDGSTLSVTGQVVDWANNVANKPSVLSNTLAKSGADILVGPISMTQPSAILVGTMDNGLYLGSTGIVGRRSGQTTFVVDQAGNASFKGTLYGSDITGVTGTFSGQLAAGTVDFASSVGTTTVYSTVGTFYFTVPTGMTRVRATLQGGGGGGGGGSARTGWFTYGGGGGGSGGYATSVLVVTPGQVLQIVVGAGGAAGTQRDGGYSVGGAAGAGGATYVSGLLTANGGGAGGVAASTANGGVKGTGSIGTDGGTGLMGVSGGAGGSSPFGSGGPGGRGSADAGGGLNASVGGVGSGGGGGGTNVADNGTGANGAVGGRGHAIIEAYDPGGVVLKGPFDLLKTELRAQGHTLT